MGKTVKPILIRAVHIAAIILFILSTRCGAASSVSVSSICANKSHYHTKLVVSIGRVENMFEKLSRKGNYYYTFDLVDAGDRVRVFSFGKPQVKNGDKVVVRGVYYKVRTVGHYVFEHEIDVTDGYVSRMKLRK